MMLNIFDSKNSSLEPHIWSFQLMKIHLRKVFLLAFLAHINKIANTPQIFLDNFSRLHTIITQN